MVGECGDLCEKCEERLQPFLDRELTDEERIEAEAHLAACEHCARRYRFEESLRRYVRKCCDEPMPVELKEKLHALRTDMAL
jgi:anti-sigma factor (TIGR02949 family)